MERISDVEDKTIEYDESVITAGWVARRCAAELRHDRLVVRRAMIARHLPDHVVERLKNAEHPYAQVIDRSYTAQEAEVESTYIELQLFDLG